MVDKKITLWLIDDDSALRLVLTDAFVEAGFDVIAFTQAHGAWTKLNAIKQNHIEHELPDVILTDIRMPMMDGLSFSEWLHQNFPTLPVVIMTAHADLQSAVDSYQSGAFDYLPKPFDLDDAVLVIQKAAQKSLTSHHSSTSTKSQDNYNSSQNKPIKNSHHAQSKPDTSHQTNRHTTKPQASPPKPTKKSEMTPPHGIIGQSVAMQTVFRAIGRLSHTAITVLITGESGTGKELVANAVHQSSPRKNQPFIALNMAAIPHDLIESELFGHEKGAFTGASTQRQGHFEQAHGGTLFLDEIGDMPYSTQTRLLRVLANGEFFRVGGQKPIKVNVRIIAATHQNLESLVKQGKFREDLFYRLNVIRLPLPPLRERKEDIPALIHHFMNQAAKEMTTSAKRIHPNALAVMQSFHWSGNVRQLENACRWLTVMAIGDEVGIEDLPPELLNFFHQQYDTTSNLPYQSSTPITPTKPQNLPHHLQTDQQDAMPTWQSLLKQSVLEALINHQNEIATNVIEEAERILIEQTLTYTKGHKSETAHRLGIGRNTLTRKIKQLHIHDTP